MINQVTPVSTQLPVQQPDNARVNKSVCQKIIDFVKYPFYKDQLNKIASTKGIAQPVLKLLAEKIMNLPGFNEGDNVELDGPLWYNGNGRINKFNENVLDFNMRMKVPGDFDTYKVKDGKINISIKVEKQAKGSVLVTTTDHNDNNKAIVEKGNIIAGTNKYTIKGETQTVMLEIKGTGKLTLTSDQMGGHSIDISQSR